MEICTDRTGEGGEQGDALMPLFFSSGQHQALAPWRTLARVHG